MADVLIAGGGIAGSSVAIMLGRMGLEVELYERSAFPREKPCGEGLMPGGVSVLSRLGLQDAVGGAPFFGIRYHARGGVAEGRFPLVDGMPWTGLGVRRKHFDAALFQAAASTPGVHAVAGLPVDGPLIVNSRVTGLFVDGASRRAPLVVAADGMHSRIRHRLGLDVPERRKRMGMRCHFRLASGRQMPPWVNVYVERGYELYVTPLPDGEMLVAALFDPAVLTGPAEVAFAAWRSKQLDLSKLLEGAEQITDVQCAWPLSGRARRGYAPGVVLLGDAAGFTDPITGGGMTQALMTAELLAAFTGRGVAKSDAWLREFERARNVMLRDFRYITSMAVRLADYPNLAARFFASLKHWPALFYRLIGVSGGMCGLLPSFARGNKNRCPRSYSS